MRRFHLALAAALIAVAGSAAWAAPSGASAPEAPRATPPGDAGAPLSLSARKVYEQARSQLVQIRTVLKGQASQASVGSGFVVSAEGHLITNFHVVSEAVLKPERYELVRVDADGHEAPVQVLMLDVLHDLALLKGHEPKGHEPKGHEPPGGPHARRWRFGPPPSGWPRGSACTRWATRWTSVLRSSKATTTASSNAASTRRFFSPVR